MPSAVLEPISSFAPVVKGAINTVVSELGDLEVGRMTNLNDSLPCSLWGKVEQ